MFVHPEGVTVLPRLHEKHVVWRFERFLFGIPVLDPDSEHVAGVYGVGIGIFGFESGEAGHGAVEGG